VTSPNDRTPATPRHAATAILLREAREVEVLVIRRHENLAFMGGMWVFPGGTLSPADTSPAALARIPERSRERCPRLFGMQGEALDPVLCLGLAVAAYRETFEETGVLLATDASGRQCSGDVLARTQVQRDAVAKEAQRFAALLEAENLLLDVDRLTYWAHWITPSNVPKRFDTRFFAIVVPAEQTADIDTVEAVAHAWMSPAALIEAARAGRMSVAQPTLYNLLELDASLREHGSLAAMLAAEAHRAIVPILPKVISATAESRSILLPWDPEYQAIPGEGTPSGVSWPARLASLPSRTIQKL
jgi:8-oxo-dGTP pyrophosphatase MutT (NUDIX family)